MVTFPLWPIVDGKCACGNPKCAAVGKHPKVYGWQAGAPVSEGEPYGIATGEECGVFVVDLDVKNDKNGVAVFDALADGREVPDTLIVKTGGGGLHLYFQYPDHFVGNPTGKDGFDVRGEGGYVVGPGSPHKSGDTYEVLVDVPPAPAPEWLLEEIQRRSARTERAAGEGAPTPIDIASEEGQRRVMLFEEALLTMPPSIEGAEGSNALLRVALRGVRMYELPLDWCADRIEEVFNPRCEPPWSESEILHKLESARDESSLPCGSVYPAWFKEFCERGALPPALRDMPAVAPPAADYSYAVGTIPADPDRKRQALTTLVQTMQRDEAWDGVWYFDEFDGKIHASHPPCALDAETEAVSDNDILKVRCWFETKGVDAIDKDVRDAITVAADSNKRHSVREYLSTLPPASPGALHDLCVKGLGVTDEQSIDYVRKFMIGAVRRVLKPGCKMDTMLVLVGPQGARKSTFVECLFSEPWTKSQMAELDNKDSSHGLQGFWCVEFAELDKVLRKEMSTVKEYLTRRVDNYRPPYGRNDIARPRQMVGLGTVNEKEILRDPTGARRFWPVEICGLIDTDWVKENRDLVWAEALAAALTDEQHWYRDEGALEAGKDGFMKLDPMHDQIRAFCVGLPHVLALDIWQKVIGGEAKDFKGAEANRIYDALTQLGCTSTRMWVGTKQVRAWLTPAMLRDERRPDAKVIPIR